MTYLENLQEMCITMNRTSLHYHDGKAWNNKKKKTAKRQWPRGKFFRKFQVREHSAEGRKLIDDIKALTNAASSLKAQ